MEMHLWYPTLQRNKNYDKYIIKDTTLNNSTARLRLIFLKKELAKVFKIILHEKSHNIFSILQHDATTINHFGERNKALVLYIY